MKDARWENSPFGTALCSVDHLKQLVIKRWLCEPAEKALTIFFGAAFVEEQKNC